MTIVKVADMFLLSSDTGRGVKIFNQNLPSTEMQKMQFFHSAQNKYAESKCFSAARL